jgi:acyl carrier protein
MSTSNSGSKSEIIRSTVLTVLASRLVGRSFGGKVDASTQLLELGLIDSKDLIDIILEVEERCAVEFDPAHIDFESGLTLGGLINAFVSP